MFDYLTHVKYNTYKWLIQPLYLIIFFLNFIYFCVTYILLKYNNKFIIEINYYANICFNLLLSLYLLIKYNPFIVFEKTTDDERIIFVTGFTLLSFTITTGFIGNYLGNLFKEILAFELKNINLSKSII